jgi:hypothetical protein
MSLIQATALRQLGLRQAAARSPAKKILTQVLEGRRKIHSESSRQSNGSVISTDYSNMTN